MKTNRHKRAIIIWNDSQIHRFIMVLCLLGVIFFSIQYSDITTRESPYSYEVYFNATQRIGNANIQHSMNNPSTSYFARWQHATCQIRHQFWNPVLNRIGRLSCTLICTLYEIYQFSIIILLVYSYVMVGRTRSIVLLFFMHGIVFVGVILESAAYTDITVIGSQTQKNSGHEITQVNSTDRETTVSTSIGFSTSPTSSTNSDAHGKSTEEDWATILKIKNEQIRAAQAAADEKSGKSWLSSLFSNFFRSSSTPSTTSTPLSSSTTKTINSQSSSAESPNVIIPPSVPSVTLNENKYLGRIYLVWRFIRRYVLELITYQLLIAGCGLFIIHIGLLYETVQEACKIIPRYKNSIFIIGFVLATLIAFTCGQITNENGWLWTTCILFCVVIFIRHIVGSGQVDYLKLYCL